MPAAPRESTRIMHVLSAQSGLQYFHVRSEVHGMVWANARSVEAAILSLGAFRGEVCSLSEFYSAVQSKSAEVRDIAAFRDALTAGRPVVLANDFSLAEACDGFCAPNGLCIARVWSQQLQGERKSGEMAIIMVRLNVSGTHPNGQDAYFALNMSARGSMSSNKVIRTATSKVNKAGMTAPLAPVPSLFAASAAASSSAAAAAPDLPPDAPSAASELTLVLNLGDKNKVLGTLMTVTVQG